MNASKRILVYSKDREIIDAVRSVAASLSCCVSTVDYEATETLDMDVLAIGHFARVFDAEIFRLIAYELRKMIDEYGVPQGPDFIIGDLGDSDAGDVELFSDANDPHLERRLHQALELWRIETGLDTGYTGAIARYGQLVDSVAPTQPIVPLPLLIQVSERYRRARTRVMVFGLSSTGCTPIMPRQTRTWFYDRGHGFPVDIARLDSLYEYQRYVLARTSTQSRLTAAWITSLWRIPIADGERMIDPLWNDLTKIPMATNSSLEESAVTEISSSLISLELAVTQPDVALFMVDQTEESEIVNTVSGAALYDIPGVAPTLVRQVAGGGLPNASYRVCREENLQLDDERSIALSNLLHAELGPIAP